MTNRSDTLPPPGPSSAPFGATRTRELPGSSVTVPTAFELYFGGLPADSPQYSQREDAFFNDIWVRHGTSKMTGHHRLDDLNELVEPLLPPDRPLELLDIAVSSGISTVEWTQSLAAAGIAHRMVAGDAVIDAYLLSCGERLRALVDRTGFLMQLEIAGRAVRVPRPRCLGRLRFLPAILLVRGLFGLFEPTTCSPGTASVPTRRWGITCRALKLVTRSLLEQPEVEVIEDDILRPRDDGRRFHVIRAANILNRGYFDDRTLMHILAHLRARLRPNGLLVVCRTMPGGRNDATIFRLQASGGFAAAARLNSGSEIADVVLALDASTAVP